MNDIPNGPDSGEDSAPLDDWLAQLSGRRPATLPGLAELRASIAAHAASESQRLLGDAAGAQAEAQALERLRFRLRREGLVGVAPNRAGLRRGRWPQVGIAAAGLVMAAGLTWWLAGSSPSDPGLPMALGEPPVFRGGTQPVRIVDSQPLRAARAVAAQLAPVEARAMLYSQDAGVVLDLVVPAERVVEARAAVADPQVRQALQPGPNRLVFVPPR